MDNQIPGGPDFGQNSDIPSGNLPLPADDAEIKISNTGQRIAVIAVLVAVVAAVIAVLVMMNNKKKEIQKYEDVRAAFQKAHLSGYRDFWKAVQVDVKGLKNNDEFEAKMRVVTTDPVRYARHVKENGIIVLDKSLPDYKAIVAPSDLVENLAKISEAVVSMKSAWNEFATEFLKYEDYFKSLEKLETASSHWVGFQQQKDNEKFLLNAVRYFKVLRCVLKDAKLEDLDFESMETEVTNTCAAAAAKPEWFSRTAFECLAHLSAPAGVPDDDFKKAIEIAAKTPDTTSKFGIDTCLKKSKEFFESEQFHKLALPWLEYIKAQNDLLKAIDEKIKSLQK